MQITSFITCTSVTSITETSANVTVGYNGQGTESSLGAGNVTAYIQYSTSASFPDPIQQPVGQAVPNVGNQSINATFTGLTPGTTYYYRGRIVSNSPTSQEAFSNVCSFTTLNPSVLPVITNYTCVAPTLTCDSAQRQISVNPKGIATAVKTKYGTATGVYTQTSSITNLPAINGDQNYFINLTGLSASTQYFYIVSATNADGTTNTSECSFTTPVCPIIVPEAALTITCPATVTNTTVSVTGAANANSRETYIGSGVAAVYTQYRKVGASVWLQDRGGNISNTGVQNISGNITGLLQNTNYEFRFRMVYSYPTAGDTYSTICPIKTNKKTIDTDYYLPTTTLECVGEADCDNLLTCDSTLR